MSELEKIDAAIARMIGHLEEEYGRTGLFNTPSDERKKDIIKQIATLRSSMNKEFPPKKK